MKYIQKLQEKLQKFDEYTLQEQIKNFYNQDRTVRLVSFSLFSSSKRYNPELLLRNLYRFFHQFNLSLYLENLVVFHPINKRTQQPFISPVKYSPGCLLYSGDKAYKLIESLVEIYQRIETNLDTQKRPLAHQRQITQFTGTLDNENIFHISRDRILLVTHNSARVLRDRQDVPFYNLKIYRRE